ncbi:hypothetical protein LCGC14_1253280 [marine sediment metagenome]|uniref:Uncharacterized protein n=1 Tax=marine sediment metagenome TaxID=412755 RepID=A0A0F9L2P1_9ZZZZ
MIRDTSKLPKWAQIDLEDMANSYYTSFDRCNKCERLHDSNIRCPYCGHDNSLAEEATNELVK